MNIGDLVNATFKYLQFGNAVMDVEGKRAIWNRENFIEYCNAVPKKKDFHNGDIVELYVLDIGPDVIQVGKTVMTEKIELVVSLKDNNTGEVKDIEWICNPCTDLSKDELIEGAIYIWTEGNYSCDCNRLIEFYGWPDDDDEKIPCGHERFRLLSMGIKDTGIYIVSLDEDAGKLLIYSPPYPSWAI